MREASGAVADVGVLLPIALAMIVVNGLSVTAVLVPAGLLYVCVAVVYRVPVAVQPLKAFGAIAIATGAGPEVIAAGSLLTGALFVVLGLTGSLTRLARVMPVPVIRGVQAAVGLTLALVGVRLILWPPESFVGVLSPLVAGGLALGVLAFLLIRRGAAALIVVAAGGLAALAVTVASRPDGARLTLATLAEGWGPTALAFPHLSLATFALAATALVLPQVPLTVTNSCVAPADAAQRYFGAAARTVTPSRLGITLGLANLGIGAIGGMPVCHGAGGMSAHHLFGARTWRAPALIGGALVVAGLGAAGLVAAVIPAFPLAALAALLGAAGLAHLRLLSDVKGWGAWATVGVVGLVGVAGYLLVGVLLGVALHLALNLATRQTRAARPSPAHPHDDAGAEAKAARADDAEADAESVTGRRSW